MGSQLKGVKADIAYLNERDRLFPNARHKAEQMADVDKQIEELQSVEQRTDEENATLHWLLMHKAWQKRRVKLARQVSAAKGAYTKAANFLESAKEAARKYDEAGSDQAGALVEQDEGHADEQGDIAKDQTAAEGVEAAETAAAEALESWQRLQAEQAAHENATVNKKIVEQGQLEAEQKNLRARIAQKDEELKGLDVRMQAEREQAPEEADKALATDLSQEARNSQGNRLSGYGLILEASDPSPRARPSLDDGGRTVEGYAPVLDNDGNFSFVPELPADAPLARHAQRILERALWHPRHPRTD